MRAHATNQILGNFRTIVSPIIEDFVIEDIVKTAPAARAKIRLRNKKSRKIRRQHGCDGRADHRAANVARAILC
jgi:hypothetical protein